jgi:hypothetical protein
MFISDAIIALQAGNLWELQLSGGEKGLGDQKNRPFVF